MKSVRSCIVAATVVLAAGGANAASVTFGLGCGKNVNGESVSCNTAPGGWDKVDEYNALPDSFTVSVSGIDLTVSGEYLEGPANGSGGVVTSVADGGAAKVGRYYGGAGVNNKPNDQHTVDGYGRDGRRDYLRLAFSETMSITNLMFRYFTSGSNFALVGDTNGDGYLSVGDEFVAGSVAGSVGVSPSFTNDTFFVYAPKGSSFKLKSITGHAVVPEIPLPAAGWLMLAGLGGLAAMRKRKS